jgi:hypothetical protein
LNETGSATENRLPRRIVAGASILAAALAVAMALREALHPDWLNLWKVAVALELGAGNLVCLLLNGLYVKLWKGSRWLRTLLIPQAIAALVFLIAVAWVFFNI